MSKLTEERLAGVVITIDDVIQAGHCASGARRWCHDNGLSLQALMTCGIPASEALRLQDALALQIVERKLQREGL